MAESTPGVTFAWRATPAGRALVSPLLHAVADHLFSSRDVTAPGVHTPEYATVGRAFGVEATDVVRVRQVHGCAILMVREGDEVPSGVEADAIVSTDPHRVVLVRVADCVPLLFADRQGRAVAAVHAGWRGTAAGMAGCVVEAFAALGVAPADLIVAIGPSIGPCCYQVDDAVREALGAHGHAAAAWFTADADAPGRWRLDLWTANRAQLEAHGVPASSIHVAQACTADDPGAWYSHRTQGAEAGRMVAAIRLRGRGGPQGR